MPEVKHEFSKTFCWEELSDLEEDVMDMVEAIVPNGEYPGTVKITVTYNPLDI